MGRRSLTYLLPVTLKICAPGSAYRTLPVQKWTVLGTEPRTHGGKEVKHLSKNSSGLKSYFELFPLKSR
jgi:hypothetical protein